MLVKVVLYWILFSVSLLVFDSLTTVFAVVLAIFALYFFTIRRLGRGSSEG